MCPRQVSRFPWLGKDAPPLPPLRKQRSEQVASRPQLPRSWSTRQVIAGPTCAFCEASGRRFDFGTYVVGIARRSQAVNWGRVFPGSKGSVGCVCKPVPTGSCACSSVELGALSQQAITKGRRNCCEVQRGRVASASTTPRFGVWDPCENPGLQPSGWNPFTI